MRSKTDRIMCGTCQYWTGNRDAVFDKKGVPKVEIHDNRGICENVNSRFCDEQRYSDSSCVKFSKWTELL